MSVRSGGHFGHPSSASINNKLVPQVYDLVQNDRRLTVCEIAGEVGNSYGSCEAILPKEVRIMCVSAKFVPRLQFQQQKEDVLYVAVYSLECIETNENF